MVRSGKGDQVLFIHGTKPIDGRKGRPNRVLISERLRLDWGSWSGLMIADYALMVGIRLAGLPTIDDIVNRLRKAWQKDLS